MRLSEAGLAAIRRHEGLRLKAYPDPGSSNGLPITIGYGSTRKLDGSPWALSDTITEAQAVELLRRDVLEVEEAVSRLVKVPLSQGQFDALVSFAFNVGAGAFGDSTLLRRLNEGDYDGAAEEFSRWVFNDGKIMPGLQRRREAEQALFRQSAPIERKDTMSPFLVAALPALVDAIPGLIRTFGKGEVTERNAKAAEAVLEVVQTATGTTNAQSAVEAVKADPAARTAATEALYKEGWFEVTEAGGGGLEGAREFAKDAGEQFWKMGVFWITVLLLPLLYGTVYLVLTGSTEQFSGELRAAIASSVVTGVLGGIIGFWLGLKFSAHRQAVTSLGR